MPWLRNEDAALKYKLQNLLVFDGNAPGHPAGPDLVEDYNTNFYGDGAYGGGRVPSVGGRPVPVRFLLPQDEIANLTYPCIIIKHLPMSYGEDRAHSGYIQLPYAPEGYPGWWNASDKNIDPAQSPYFSYFPTPVNIDYQVTLLARFMTQHIQPLMATLVTEPYLPFKYGYLNVPQDGTHRRLTVESGPIPGYGKDEDNKRLFTVDWRIRVGSEIVPTVSTMEQYGGTLVPVNTIDIDLSVYADTMPIDLDTPAGIQKNMGIHSGGSPSQFNVQQEP